MLATRALADGRARWARRAPWVMLPASAMRAKRSRSTRSIGRADISLRPGRTPALAIPQCTTVSTRRTMAGAMSVTRSPAVVSPANRDAVVLLGICLGFFVILLDATAVNVALGAISASLGGSIAALQWVVNAYTVVFAGLMLVAGSVADRRGALWTFRAGLAAFAAASTTCALAPSIGVLVGARAVQGIGAAAILPASLALIAQRFPTNPGRARALGVWGGVSGVGLAAGPPAGGAPVSAVGGRARFPLGGPPPAPAAPPPP